MSWPTKKLGEICDINGGDAAPQDYAVFSSDGVPFVRMQDLGRYHVTDNLIETRDKIKTEAVNRLRVKIFPKGSIILPRSGSVFANHRAILGIDAAVVSHIAILNNYKGVEPRYLFWYLTKLDIGRHAVKTSNVDSISFQRLGKFEIPIPALNTQKQIVDRLDKIAEVQKLNDNLISKTNELFQSLLHKELSPDGKNWKIQKLEVLIGEIKIGPFGSALKIAELHDRGPVRVLFIENVVNNEFELAKEKFITEEKYKELKVYTVKSSDILVTMMGTIGRTCITPENIGRAIISSHLIKISPSKEFISSDFLNFSLHNPYVTDQIRRKAKGAIMKGLNSKILKGLKIPLPPLKTQEQIVAKLSAVQNHKKQLFEQKAKLKELFDSTLHKSFQPF